MPNNKNPAGCCPLDTCCSNNLKITVKGSTCTIWTCQDFLYDGTQWFIGGGPSCTMTCSGGIYTISMAMTPPTCADGQGSWQGGSFQQTVQDCNNFNIRGQLGPVRSTCALCGGEMLTITIQSTC